MNKITIVLLAIILAGIVYAAVISCNRIAIPGTNSAYCNADRTDNAVYCCPQLLDATPNTPKLAIAISGTTIKVTIPNIRLSDVNDAQCNYWTTSTNAEGNCFLKRS